MNKTKKFTSLFLSLAMLITSLSAVPISALAATKTGKCGYNAKYSYDSSSGTLTISGTGDMFNYDFDWCDNEDFNIKKVVINKGIERIGDNAFACAENITSISIPNTVKEIGGGAFSGCAEKSISIPASVEYIGDDAFCGSNLKAINVAKDNKVYSSKDGVLYNKKQTRLLYLPNGIKTYKMPNTVKTVANWASSYNENLENLTLSKNLVSVGKEAFSDCKKLKSVTIPKSVKTLGVGAFSSQSLKKVTILNKKLELNENWYYFGHYTTVYGYKNSTAQAYAKAMNLSFVKIKVPATKITSLSSNSKGFTVKWEKKTSNTTGYQIKYATNSKFNNSTSIDICDNTTISKSISKLTGNKRYYVKVRTYKISNGIRIYSSWSKAKTVVTKQ